jgi:ATP-dependent Clp protease ATP-binding subunit ClpA
MDNSAETQWMADGNCAEKPPSLFFPSDGVGVEAARRVCEGCPVKDQCLNYALDNRIDHGVEFKPLGRSTIERITRLELDSLAKREGFLDRKISLEFGEELVRRVASAGFDPVYGARPLQRAIEEQVVMPLARLLVEAPDSTGKHICLDWDVQGNRLLIAEKIG